MTASSAASSTAIAARFARTPAPPYLAVIFTTQRQGDDDGFGITVSYWADEAAVLGGKRHVERAYGTALSDAASEPQA